MSDWMATHAWALLALALALCALTWSVLWLRARAAKRADSAPDRERLARSERAERGRAATGADDERSPPTQRSPGDPGEPLQAQPRVRVEVVQRPNFERVGGTLEPEPLVPPPEELPPASGTRYPVVLAHGVMGFDSIEVGRVRQRYFRGVVERLEAEAVQVHVVRVNPLGSVPERAAQLAEQVHGIDAPRVNIVAHSMGGLDARYAISRLGLREKVAALVTIGTPHRGTPLADTGTSLLGDRLGLRRMLEALGGSADAFWELTERNMVSFNSQIENAPEVFYASYVGVTRSRSTAAIPFLLPSYLWLTRRAGGNDGLVPADSQRWGNVLGEIPANHWAQIGWAPGFDAAGFYRDVVSTLKARGF